MIIVAIIYWSVDRKLGLRLAVFLPLVASLNSLLKQVLHAPRPYWLDPDIRAIQVSNGFGMPSGHAQASTVWLYAAALLKKRGFWILAAGVAFMVGLSRVYLGVHFPGQVLLGWLIGIGVLVPFIRLEERFLAWFLKGTFGRQLLFISGISLLMLLLGGMILYLHKDWEMPLKWVLNSADDLAGRDESIRSSLGLGAVAGNAGGFLGVALGALLFHRQGGFDPGGKLWKRLLRSISGLLVLAAIYGIFHGVSPDHSRELLYSTWRFAGFFLISFSAIFLIPQLFKKTGLLSGS
jgi:hypothetical protein